MFKFLFIAAVILASLFAVVRYLELNGIFYPTRDVAVTPGAYRIPYEDVFMMTQDGVKIHGWYVKHPSAKSVLLYFHGNGGNISGRIEKLKSFHEMGVNFFIIDYRGYGRSEGHPSEQGVYADALAAYDHLVKDKGWEAGQIVGYGASLGGAVLIQAATKRPFGALIVDSSFSSAADMAKIIYPFLPTAFMSVKMDSAAKIKGLRMPKLFIYSSDDEVVPPSISLKLFEAADAPKKLIETQGGHNNNHIASKDIFWRAIRDFLNENGML